MARCVCGDASSGSVQGINQDSWLIGTTKVLTRYKGHSAQNLSGVKSVWFDGEHLYTITDALLPHGTKCDVAGNDECRHYGTWSIGRTTTILVLDITDRESFITRPDATFQWISNRKPSCMKVPNVLYHMEDRKHYYLIYEEIEGETLENRWGSLSPLQIEAIAQQVANAIQEATKWQRRADGANPEVFCGVDGMSHPDKSLLLLLDDNERPTAKVLADLFQRRGLWQGGAAVFSPGLLGAHNILVDNDLNFAGLSASSLSCAGFAPRGWPRAQFQMGIAELNCPSQKSEDIARAWSKTITKHLEDASS